MRSGRGAVRTALPLLALGALALLAGLRPAPAAPLLTAGLGSVSPLVDGRVVTDGHPQPVAQQVRRVAAAAPAVPVREKRAATRAVRHVAGPVAAPVRVSKPARTVVRRTSTTADAYPYANDTSGGSDEWGFTKRQCVSYVAWRLAAAGRPLDNGRDHWGSALDWDDVAAHLGYDVSSRPAVGTVAQWNAGERSAYWSGASSSSDGTFVAGSAGHVAWVTAVYSDGSVQVAQYNGTGDRAYSTMRVKAPRYLYV